MQQKRATKANAKQAAVSAAAVSAAAVSAAAVSAAAVSAAVSAAAVSAAAVSAAAVSAAVSAAAVSAAPEKKKRERKLPAPAPIPDAALTSDAPVVPSVDDNALIELVVPTAPKKKRSNKKQTQSAQTTQPTQSAQTTQPTQSAQPTQPTQSAQPTQPTQSAQPTQPTQSAQPTQLDMLDAPVVPVVPVCAHKKRGRKPKGGKVIQQLVNASAAMHDAPNIILHLKCSASDIPGLNTDASVKPGDVISFNDLETKGADLNESYDGGNGAVNFIMSTATNSKKPRTTSDALVATNSYTSYNHLNHDGDDDDDDDETGSNDKNLKDIWKKLNHLKLCFHKSDVFQNIGAGTRRSCCFWDTCEFDTPPVYIPRCITANGGHSVYGCFCSPECALAYLMNEGVDTSVKFERCQMLNSMYGRVLNYEKSIKPAPNPQYILNKFYGNLSIQEYRKLFKSEQIIYVVNKPLTHILPEMYEDNNDFLLNNKVIPNNTYKLKKKTNGGASVTAFG
jgi:hypothetical protein